jgi:hypothetical protein
MDLLESTVVVVVAALMITLSRRENLGRKPTNMPRPREYRLKFAHFLIMLHGLTKNLQVNFSSGLARRVKFMEINNGHSPSKLMTLVQRRSKERYLHGPSLQFTDVDLFVAVRAFYA